MALPSKYTTNRSQFIHVKKFTGFAFVAIVDLDEFIVHEHFLVYTEILKSELLPAYPDAAAFSLNVSFFLTDWGISGVEPLMTSRYIKRSNPLFHRYKNIYLPNKIVTVDTHLVWPRKGYRREKCQFGVSELEFYGYRFTKDGLKPTTDKVKAVKDCKAPESKEAVRSFLGMIGYLSKFIPRYTVLTAPLRELTKKEVKFKWGKQENEAFKTLKDSITDEKTMAFFDPKRPIIVRTEASYHEGLSAGLFQHTAKGLQPKLKNDETEQIVKQIIESEHAIVLSKIREETSKDVRLQDVMQRQRRNDWEKHKSRPEIATYYMVRNELYILDEVLFRLNQIVIPESLQRKVIKAAHSMGHLGLTKTKQMLRARYWFPALNSMVEDIIGRCYECKVTTKEHRQEPIKPTKIPETAWHTLAADYGGPYPDGHYNLVVIDKRTRYPVVEQTKTTTTRATIEKLRGIFSTHGIPEKIETDNGSSFSSNEFSNFATEMGFYHHKITPLHPRANGEAENFMKLLNKTEQIAHMKGNHSNDAIQDMLMGYRSTPHPATGFTPYAALMNRDVRTKLDHVRNKNETENMNKEITERDKEYNSFKISDHVLFKQEKRNKWSTAYELEPYIIYKISGSSIGAQRKSDGRKVFRDSSHFKLANNIDIPNSNGKWRDRISKHIKANGDKHMVEPGRRKMLSRTMRVPARLRHVVV
ncbi:unnamed protein product [Mytilus edulis]|uniref:Integrase catalytic domain-containing protein n=1 Tax=Mytilus edulis TaxID=6550 RepID=A0A8S3R4E7_MYTED|nr:unnamed protein product [Mytilus edulis]